MTTFNNLREANTARQKEWDPGDYIDMDWRGNELGGEIGEVCNVLKKLHRHRFGLPGSRATVGDLAEELADGVICLDLYLMTVGHEPAETLDYYADYLRLNFETLPAAGRKLFADTGRLITLPDTSTGLLPEFSGKVLTGLFGLAEREKIDLPQVVAIKFNATSEKVGLATRMALTDN